MQEFAEEYIKELSQNCDFKRLLELKKQIDQKYSSLIVNFKNKEAEYFDAQGHPEYQMDLKKMQKEFVSAKTKLYSKEEVKEYFTLERKIQKNIDEDFNRIKESISKKFILKNMI